MNLFKLLTTAVLSVTLLTQTALATSADDLPKEDRDHLEKTLYCTALLTYIDEEFDYDSRTRKWLHIYKKDFWQSLKDIREELGKSKPTPLMAEKAIQKVRVQVGKIVYSKAQRLLEKRYIVAHRHLNADCLK